MAFHCRLPATPGISGKRSMPSSSRKMVCVPLYASAPSALPLTWYGLLPLTPRARRGFRTGTASAHDPFASPSFPKLALVFLRRTPGGRTIFFQPTLRSRILLWILLSW